MTLADHIDAHGLTCASCRCDVATAGFAPGDGFIYCPPCYHAGRRATAVEQLDLFGATS